MEEVGPSINGLVCLFVVSLFLSVQLLGVKFFAIDQDSMN
jgi:hypothetical protein